MQPVNQSKSLVKGALVLTVAALIIKILSAVYRIPFQNIVGDTGFYIYQQVYPLYGVALVLATTGFPIVISKLYTEQKSREDQQKLLVISAIFLLILGILLFACLYFGAEWIGKQMNDPKLSILIRVISVVFLITPITALLRGYYQGIGNMIPTATSQVGEQIIRVGTILVTAFVFVKANYSMYEVGAGAAFGSVTGGLIGALILVTFIWVKKDYKSIQVRKIIHNLKFKEASQIFKLLFVQGFAVCVSGMLLLLLQLADSLNLYSLLIASGINGEDAKVLKGVYDRGQPLIQLGTIVATSMSLSLVPLIASERMKKNMQSLNEKVHLSLRVSVVIGLGATVGLMTIMEPTNIMLFENSNGSNVLALLGCTVLFGSIILTLIAIFQGFGYTLFPAIIVLVGFGMKYALNLVLVQKFGTMGAAWASNGALALIMVILLIRLQILMQHRLKLGTFLVKAAASSIAMFFVLKGFIYLTDYLYLFGHERLIATIQSLGAVACGGLTYLLVVIRTRIFTKEELTLLPFGSRIIYLFPSRKRR
ncbi:polysaccharide biosynthesis protein [Bacillaceae bacterium CLA-AA-H227]|uniref:Polysaccharide biosynthesis protein n=1 Tax=Robertmurraya yapensis (ex Hitch et al 2024) TaxID=3133160 RepID=A0ACC6SG54_9BACI